MDLFQQQKFTPNTSEWLSLGSMTDTLWLAFTIQNNSNQRELVIELRNPRLAYADLFIPDGAGGYDFQENGLLRPYKTRLIDLPTPAYPVLIEPGHQTTILFRLRDTDDMRLRLWLSAYPVFTNRATTAYYPELVGIGIFLILALLHFLLYFALREKAYLYLGCIILAWLIFNMAADGTGHKLLWRDSPWFADRALTISLALLQIFFLLFTASYLNTRHHTPKLFNAVRLVIGLCLAHLVFLALMSSPLRMTTGLVFGIGALLLPIILTGHAIRQGSRTALYFAASWTGVVLFLVALILFNTYLIPADWLVGTPMLTFLFSTSIALWSLQLTLKLRGEARIQHDRLEHRLATLTDLLPICSYCRNIRDDKGEWSNLETYIDDHTSSSFTHGICPDCAEVLYPDKTQTQ